MKAAIIFDLQRFSLHDGPGIRTVVFFKGCPLRCRWCQNPEGLRPLPEITFHAERCVAAGDCRRVCRREAILPHPPAPSPVAELHATGEGERPLKFESLPPLPSSVFSTTGEGGRGVRWEACDHCGLCAEACPSGALRMAGRRYEVDELLDEVLRDQAFYKASGGGVTVSGGEPTLQMDFLIAFLRRCKDSGLHTAMETCGWAEWEQLAGALPFCDLVLYDVKAIDADLHRQLTGQGNARILENLRRLIAAGVSLIPRVPLIPTLTATPQNLSDIAHFLREAGLTVVHVLPYHRLGEAKLARMNSPLPPLSLPLLAEREVEAMAGVFREAGLTAVVGGA